MTSQGIEKDGDIEAALAWFAAVAGDPRAFVARLERAQQAYRETTSLPENFGQDPKLTEIQDDVVAVFLGQAKSLLDDRRSFDFALASKTIPWVKQIGRNVTLLDRVPGARQRAARMLAARTVLPDSAMLELVMASNYAADGFDVSFVDEEKGGARTPDMQLRNIDLPTPLSVECKRLTRGRYEEEECARHRVLFRNVAALIDARGLSVHIDVTYTKELVDVPDAYLAEHLDQALSSRLLMPRGYPWRDECGYGMVRPANLAAVRQDTRDSSLYFGTKLARLLSGRVVREGGYHLAAGADPDSRDARYIDTIHYGSVVTWQCIATTAIAKKARYVKAKLVEADRQLGRQTPGIVHLAMDVELQCESSDLRRDRNVEAIKGFRPTAAVLAIYVHYLVPRVSESHSWIVDETVDRFGPGFDPVPPMRIFQGSATIDNDLPAWKQAVPLPLGGSESQ